ncbi:pseudouridine synthase [Pseudomonadota bacterium]
MCRISYFKSVLDKNELPTLFPSPFAHTPHRLAVKAAEQLKGMLNPGKPNQKISGKMFGVLVIKDREGEIGFLSAFAGSMDGEWHLPGFVPPIFDVSARKAIIEAGEREYDLYASKIAQLICDSQYEALTKKLDDLNKQRDEAIATLKAKHKTHKLKRKQTRAALEQNQTSKDSEAQLIALSFESQRDKLELRDVRSEWNAQLSERQANVDEINGQLTSLKKMQAQCAKQARKQAYATSVLTNVLGEQQPISSFYDNNHPRDGAGECAASKLIHYAIKHGLTPIALTEFWWGESPADSIRHHGHYYPSCRGKCRPILPFMLKGLAVEAHHSLYKPFAEEQPLTVYEDDDLVVVDKPSGMLSVPGKEITDSVLTRLQKRYPNATGPLLVHRLDMATSGLLLAAKKAETHKLLQQQFEQRRVEKRYEAVLSQKLPDDLNAGTIELPLRVDFDDRPRQLVCFVHGKSATTHWKVISRESHTTRVYFYPITGRTHQLRMHAAHVDGLNAPIVGDSLYGVIAERLLLHAQRLCFTHPRSGKRIELISPTPF